MPFKLFIFVSNDLIDCDFVDVNTRTDYVCKFSLRLPIHARYRASQPNGNFVNFTLNRPLIFVRNLNDFKSNDSTLLPDDVSFEALNASKFVFPCEKFNLDYLKQSKQAEATSDLTVCEWTQLEAVSVSFNSIY